MDFINYGLRGSCVLCSLCSSFPAEGEGSLPVTYQRGPDLAGQWDTDSATD